MAQKKQARVALIGAGALANAMHYPSLAEMPDVEMVAICDLWPDKACATAEKFGIERVYGDYRKMLDETAPDAVYILMPPHHLFDLAFECLSRGHAVFVEKPPGLTTHQTRALAQHAEKNGCVSMTGFQRRFCPLLIEAQKRVSENGALTQCLARFVKNGGNQPYYNGAIDVLTCDIIHAVDSLRWMGGEVKNLSSTVSAFGGAVENAFNALMEFENGAVGMLVSNFMVGRRIFAVEMHALGISAFAEPDDRAVFYRNGDQTGEELSAAQAAGETSDYHTVGFFGENRHFIDCVKCGAQPQCNFEDGVKTMELVDRIYRARLS